jgi:hypothetical protein
MALIHGGGFDDMARTIHTQERLERGTLGNLNRANAPLDVGQYFQRLTLAKQIDLVALLRRELVRETAVLERMVAEHG